MLIRISLIVAILAAVAVGVLDFVFVQDKIAVLQKDRDDQRTAKDTAQRELATTRAELAKTNTALVQTKATLDATTAEKDKALADLDTQNKRAEKLGDDLKKTREERDAAQAELAAYKSSGLSPAQAVNAAKQIKALEDTITGQQEEATVLGRQINKLKAELAFYKPEGPHIVPLPPTLQGKVVAFDPKWNFVLLDVGEKQGALEHGQLLVNRKGKLVAKVIITRVEKDRCVANVMPGWQLGEVIEGDLVIPAYPAS